MASVQSAEIVDEIYYYQDFRSIESSEACWRLFEFDLSKKSPAVVVLRVHLEVQQPVLFRDPREVVQAAPETRMTELDAFFNCNSRHNGYNRQLTYEDFPHQFVYDQRAKRWKPRQRYFNTIGRIQTVHLLSGDVYFLRMLLTHDHCKGKTSFEDLKTIQGQTREQFKDVCSEHGLLQDDSEYEVAIREAATTQIYLQIRDLFVIMLLFCSPTNPQAFFNRHYR